MEVDVVAQYARFDVARDKWNDVLREFKEWQAQNAADLPGLKDLIVTRNHRNEHCGVLITFEDEKALDRFSNHPASLPILEKLKPLAKSDIEYFEVEVIS